MNPAQSARLDVILDDVVRERQAQLEKWGEQNHRDGTNRADDRRLADEARKRCDDRASIGLVTWRDILDEEVREAFAERDAALLRAELVQVATVCAAWVDCIDRTVARVGGGRVA